MRRTILQLTAAITWMLVGTAVAKEPPMQKFVALGTASTSGVYHPVGQAICRLVNKHRLTELVRCLTYSTGGSEYNIQAVISGELNAGITRTDLAYDAYNGTGEFASRGPAPTLRMIASLYDEPVTVLAKRKANITRFEEIRGKRINIGNRGSSQRSIVRMILEAVEVKTSDFAAITEYTTDGMGDAFCKNEVDVIVQALGMPAPFYKRMIEECDGVIIAIPSTVIDRILASYPSLMRLSIPGGIYAGHPDAIPSFGFKTALITSSDMSEETIYRLTRALTSELAEFKRQHPALERLGKETMARDGILIPLHPGAARQYREIGIQ